MATILKEIVKFKEKNPGPDIVLAYMKEVFNKNPTLVRYDKGKPYIYFEYNLEGDQTDLIENKEETDLYYAIRNVSMDEYEKPITETNPHKTLIDMFKVIEDRKLLVSHVLCGNKKRLLEWLDFSFPGAVYHHTNVHMLLGVPLFQLSELPEDVFIICGALAKYAQPNEILYTLKGNID